MSEKKINMRVLLSTFGPLHLIKSAQFLSKLVDIEVVQGWIPNKLTSILIPVASKIIGRDLSKSFAKRTPMELKGKNYGCAIPEAYLWLGKRFNWFNIEARAAELFGKMSKGRIKDQNIFHVRSGSGQGGAIAKAKRLGMKVVVDHSIAHPKFMDEHLRGEYEKYGCEFTLGLDSQFWQMIIKDCEEADAVLVNSNFVRETFIEAGFKNAPIYVIHLGVRQDFMGLKKSYEVGDKIKILFTGGFGFRKGGEYLLRAMLALEERGVKYELNVVGSYSPDDVLLATYRPKYVNFFGHVPQDELKSWLCNSDVYVFPSLCEGCAQSGMEALAAGLPVVATRESGLPITDGETGLIVDCGNVEQIVNSIIKVYSDSYLRENLGRNATKMMSESYTWDIYAECVKDMYESLLS